MTTEDLHKHALALPEDDRALLAAALLHSLPAILVDEDDGLGEARRRSKELDEDPDAGMSWEEIKAGLGR